MQIGPIAPILRQVDTRSHVRVRANEVTGQLLVPQAWTLQDPRYHGQDLPRARGLDYVVLDASGNCLGERRFLFALRNHDYGNP